VWFDEAITCRSRDEIGIPGSPDESFDLGEGDTIASFQQATWRLARRHVGLPLG